MTENSQKKKINNSDYLPITSFSTYKIGLQPLANVRKD